MQPGWLERVKHIVCLTRQYRALVVLCLLFATMMSSMTSSPVAAFQAGADASGQPDKLFFFIQGVDTRLSASDAQSGTISAEATFGIPNGPYLFLKDTYPTAECQDTLADKAIGYAPSNVLRTFATRLDTQLQNYLAGKPATDVYLIAHSQGGVVSFSYLAYLKSRDALGEPIPGTDSTVKGVITLDSPIGGIGGGLSYAQQILDVFAHAGFSCPALEEQDITLSSAKQVAKIYQSTRPAIGGRNSVMRVVFDQSISNQRLAEEAARHGLQILTVGNERDYLFGPEACNVPVEDFLSSQWLADEGKTSGVYGRVFAGGVKTCTDRFQLGMNHSVVLTKDEVHQAIEQLVDGRPVTPLRRGRNN
jgi:pimeloyl-ACP methyl ester carboxylesterase